MSKESGFFGFLRQRGFLVAWIVEAAVVLPSCCFAREIWWIALPAAAIILAFMPGFNRWVYDAFPACWQKTKKD
ncbi:MAG: hypothetical protein AAB791_01735 [Patescibacteria group bacterium]